MPETNIKQGTPEWLEAKAGVISGTAVGTILGLNQYETVNDLIRSMVRALKGAPSEFVENHHVRRGKDNEDASRFTLSLYTGIDFEEAPFWIHDKYEWIGASPDGLDATKSFGCEIKNPVKPQPLKSKPAYEAQIRLCQEVCGGQEWHYWSQPVEGDPIHEIVEYDPEWFPKILPKLQEFMELLDKEVDNPAHLEPKVEIREDEEWHKAVTNYRWAKSQVDSAKAAEEEARKELIKLAKNKSAKGSGCTLSRVEKKGNVKYSDIPELAGVDLDQYRGKPTVSYQIRLSKD